MRKIIIIFSLVLFSVASYAQDSEKEFLRLIPLENEDFKPPKIEIKSECVSDTIFAFTSVAVRFSNDICDTTKNLKPTKIYLLDLEYAPDGYSSLTLGGENRVVLHNRSEIDNDKDLCIWDTCSDFFLKWMAAQPYNECAYRERLITYRVSSFMYRFTIVPNKKEGE